MEISVFDTKPYDRKYLAQAKQADRIRWKFHEYRFGPDTARTATGSNAVCLFVNDVADRKSLLVLAELGVRLICLRCAGFNNVDLEAARELGLNVVRVPAYSPHAVAEHTIGLLMTLNRKIHRAYNRVRELNFSLGGLVGFDVHGKTVGIVGTGKIGKATAEIFRGFGAGVLASDVNPDLDWAIEKGVRYVAFEELMAQSDIVSLHVPLMPETHHLIDDRTLAMTRPGVILLNTSRGKLVDTTALISGLRTGHVGGVGLDVYEEEEGVFFEDHSDHILQDESLTQLLMFPNVLITAHQAFLTHEALSEIARCTVENAIRMMSGEPFLEGTTL
ncbi:2-hydroxyacid dehydrogenase [bacterium]|nr:2-hydroxyacid dehydrogenase [bacterium]